MPAPEDSRAWRGPVRVTPLEGSPVLLDGVTVSRDSVVGLQHTTPHARIAIPAAEVRMLEARKADPMATVALFAVPLIALTALWGAFGASRVGLD